MVKKRTFRRRKKRSSFTRRKKSSSARGGRKMQRMSLSFVRKKYTTVIPLRMPANAASTEFTISHIGGRNSTTPASTYTLTTADPDGMLATDMALY